MITFEFKREDHSEVGETPPSSFAGKLRRDMPSFAGKLRRDVSPLRAVPPAFARRGRSQNDRADLQFDSTSEGFV